MARVGIVDYGAGNIASVMKAVDYAGGNPFLASTPEQLASADRLILPGVGAAGLAIEKLRASGLDKALDETVRGKGRPLMGICVGMQLLAEDMYEFGHHKGLGWVPGRVVALQDCNVRSRPVPHMGWSEVEFGEKLSGLAGRLGRHKAFYFAHSFTLVTNDNSLVVAAVDYEAKLVAGVAFDSVAAFQFHPEKSQIAGDLLMQWFMDWNP